MKKNRYIREKAVRLRQDGHTITEICEMLKTSKSTVWYWIKDVEMLRPNAFIEKTKRSNCRAARKAAEAHRRKANLRHEENAREAERQWLEDLNGDQEFRLFLMLYMAEGIRKGRDSFGMSNTNPDLIAFAFKMMARINVNSRQCRCDLYLKENLDAARATSFWGELLGVETIHVHIREDGHLKGRNWVSENGIMLIRIYDTYVKTRLNVWMRLFTEDFLSEYSGGRCSWSMHRARE
ncbi:MAG: helix-turn-helix domain-containing protein [Candidatus Geothermincolia bacterium]